MAAQPITNISSYAAVLGSTTPETLIAGVDEVGRGALFGPVVAAAVVVRVSFLPQLDELVVRDSKRVSPKKRRELAQIIQEKALANAVGFASAAEIDQINIFQASLQSMKRAIDNLEFQPTIALVDGKAKIPDLSMKQINLIKGDERFSVIAAASIVAKVWRDDLIIQRSLEFPHYHLEQNKGYGTEKHRQAIWEYGPCVEHRRSFRPCNMTKFNKSL